MSKQEDITGGLDLLGDWLDAKGYTEEAGLCTKAMDEINRLKKDLHEYVMQAESGNQKQVAEMCELRKEITRLHLALHDIYEVYAGSEGTAGMKHPELYLQGCVQEMAYIAGKHKRRWERVMSDDIVEMMARAAYAEEFDADHYPWENEKNKEFWLNEARTAYSVVEPTIEALRAENARLREALNSIEAYVDGRVIAHRDIAEMAESSASGKKQRVRLSEASDILGKIRAARAAM